MTAIQRTFLLTSGFKGPWYPGFLAATDACAGMRAGGVSALIRSLENHLGLNIERQPYAKRMIAAERVVRRYLDTYPDCFFARSFGEDPEGSAGLLMRWREELILGGWSGEIEVLPPRIRSAMEALGGVGGEEIPAGEGERIHTLLRALSARPSRVFDTLYLLRDLSRERLLVRSLIGALERCGTAIRRWELPPGPRQEGDLSAAFAAVVNGSRFTPSADGSLLRLMGKSPSETADALAAWMKRNGTEGMVLIADDGLRAELDRACARHHLPHLGASSSSPHRSILQVLPLALSIRSEPFNPYRLLEFLELPNLPIPRRVAHELAGVVAEYPGIHGSEWRRCLEECLSKDSGRGMSGEQLEEAVRFWLPSPDRPAHRGDALPATDVLAVCARLASWAAGRARAALAADSGSEETTAAEYEMMQSVVTQSNLLADLVRGPGLESMSQVQLTRLISAAIGRGTAVEVSRPALGSPYLVSTPDAVLGPVDTVVWWNFTGSSVEPIAQPLFTASECRALAGVGIELPDPGRTAIERFECWRRPVLYAAKRVLLASHEIESDEPSEVHPIWNAIAVGWSMKDQARITVTPADMIEDSSPSMKADSEQISPLDLPRPEREWALDAVRPSLRPVESASSLESLVKCPLKYIFEYQCGLKPARTTSLPGEGRINGTIGHDLIEGVFPKGGAPLDDQEIRRRTVELFDRLVREEGATLLLPGRELDLERLRSDISRAALAVGRLLREHGLRVEKIEERYEQLTELGKIAGAIDILLSGPKGRRMILDMKYSKWGERYYREYLEKGLAIQLAVYARLVDPTAPVAYVSLKDAGIISPKTQAVPGAFPVEGASMAETWAKLRASVEFVLKEQIAARKIRATGITLEGETEEETFGYEGGLAGLEPPCVMGCDFSPVCGRVWAEQAVR